MYKRVSLGLAVALVIALSILTAQLIKSFQLDASLAASGFTWTLAVQPIRQQIERLLQRLSRRQTTAEPSLQEPSRPWYELFVIGTLMYVGIVELGGFIAGVASGAVVSGDVNAQRALIFGVGIVTAVTATALIGFFVGVQARSRGAMIFFATIVASRAALIILDFIVVANSTYQELFGRPKDPVFLAFATGGSVLIGITIALAAGLPLYWLGRRRRYAHYIYALLKSCSVERQRVIAEVVRTSVVEQSPKPVTQLPEAYSHRFMPASRTATR